jgi:hypothetical protein
MENRKNIFVPAEKCFCNSKIMYNFAAVMKEEVTHLIKKHACTRVCDMQYNIFTNMPPTPANIHICSVAGNFLLEYMPNLKKTAANLHDIISISCDITLKSCHFISISHDIKNKITGIHSKITWFHFEIMSFHSYFTRFQRPKSCDFISISHDFISISHEMIPISCVSAKKLYVKNPSSIILI